MQTGTLLVLRQFAALKLTEKNFKNLKKALREPVKGELQRLWTIKKAGTRPACG